jgi:hypothetical protein
MEREGGVREDTVQAVSFLARVVQVLGRVCWVGEKVFLYLDIEYRKQRMNYALSLEVLAQIAGRGPCGSSSSSLVFWSFCCCCCCCFRKGKSRPMFLFLCLFLLCDISWGILCVVAKLEIFGLYM